jgi:PAS domain S-box-containing protein
MSQIEIDQLKQRIEVLKRRVEEDRTIFDALPVMFWYKDTQNRHLRVNRAAAKLEGLPVTAIEGKTAEELYSPEQAEIFFKDDQEVIQSGQPKLGIVERHETPLGEEIWLETGKVPTRDPDGRISGVVAFAIDITAQRRVREFLSDSLKQLTEAAESGVSREEILIYLKEINRRADELG